MTPENYFQWMTSLKNLSLERINKSGAVFNIEKLRWMNEQHIRIKTDQELLEMLKPIIAQRSLGTFSDTYLLNIIALMKERVTFVSDFIDNCKYFYQDPTTFDQAAKAKNWTAETGPRLTSFAERFSQTQTFDAPSIEQELRKEADLQQISAARIIHPLRLAVTGVSVGPSLFHVLELLGKETVMRRINYAIEHI